MAETLVTALKLYGLSLQDIRLTTLENLPSRFACLRILRTIAPANLQMLKTEIESREFSVPSKSWLSKLLDTLRKNGLVLRQKNQNYALTLNGLKSLGTSKKRNSPDITRMLALSQRGG